MKRLAIALSAAFALVVAMGATPAFALFSVQADVPVQYTLTNENDIDTADSVSGYKVAASLGWVGVGLESYTPVYSGEVPTPAGDKDLEIDINMTDIFLDLPVPFVNLGVGYGVGTAAVKGDLGAFGDLGDYFKDGDLSQTFVTVGLPIAMIFDVHVGYHMLSGSVDPNDKGKSAGFDSLDAGANMLSVGARVGF